MSKKIRISPGLEEEPCHIDGRVEIQGQSVTLRGHFTVLALRALGKEKQKPGTGTLTVTITSLERREGNIIIGTKEGACITFAASQFAENAEFESGYHAEAV